MVSTREILVACMLLLSPRTCLSAFTIKQRFTAAVSRQNPAFVRSPTRERTWTHNGFRLLEGKEGADSYLDDVVELGHDVTPQNDKPVSAAVAPFLSQGEIDPEALNPDLSDPKQARVIIYIILSLIPVLFLIPLMIGSRDLIPLDAVPPVQL